MTETNPQGSPGEPQSAPDQTPATHEHVGASPNPTHQSGAYVPPPTPPTATVLPGYYQQYPPRQEPPIEGFAVASLATSLSPLAGFWFFGSVLAVIFGHIALHKIRRDNRRGHGIALTGTILGYVGIALSILLAILLVVLISFSIRYSNGIKAEIRQDVRGEVAVLEATQDAGTYYNEAGNHHLPHNITVYVAFSSDYSTYTVSGTSDDVSYTYTYDSDTGRYTENDYDTYDRFNNGTDNGSGTDGTNNTAYNTAYLSPPTRG